MPTGVREPVAAGALYASDSQALRAEIDAAVNNAETEYTSPKVMVLPSCGLPSAPHVGGSAMIMMESERDHISRVVLIQSIAFRTPLGDLLLDRGGIDGLHGHPHVTLTDRPFERNTSLEVHLPPIQRLLGTVQILPVLVGAAPTSAVVDVLERLWGGRETMIIVSSSFGRGEDVDEVAQQGEELRAALLRNELSALTGADVESPRSLAAILTVVARRSMGLLELANDTVDDPSGETESALLDVASLAAWESADMSLAEPDAAHLRALAKAAIEVTVLGGRVRGSDQGRIPPALAARRASVVTVRRDGQTRGSAGTIEADRSLAGSVVRNAAACCADPRLPSIQPSELGSLDMTISIVSPIERIFPETWQELAALLERGRHGILVTSPSGRAAQLPAMWARFNDAREFAAAVATKANVGDEVTSAAWYRFETIDY